MGPHLTWLVGNGNNILIGTDPLIGNSVSFLFPEDFRSYLEDLGITTLALAHNILPDALHYWYTAEDLYLDGEWKDLWNT